MSEHKQTKHQNKLQRKPEQVTSVAVSNKNIVIDKEEPKQVQVQEDSEATLLPETHGNVALRIVPVYLMSGNRKLKVNALLDDASMQT